ncbi:MAG: hypothetical protein COB83_11265 [Gammaproteobacteria bacterium]|nr:MAG: hypothetical protein COB83_11265 [Gammaproteobacteria bacterium]
MKKNCIEIISYTDPYCTWCWGSEPIMRKLKEQYGEQLKISYVMGGLVKDIREFHDQANAIGGEHWYRQVASHWLEASKKHHMPVDEQIYYDIKNEAFSTYPACIAFQAAKLQSEALGERYLRRLREATSIERQVIQSRAVQNKLAEEVGLNLPLFKRSINNGAANKAFKKDLQQCRNKGISGFPSFIIRGFGEEILLKGYTSYKTFSYCLQNLSKHQLKPKASTATFSKILDFIARYEKVAAIEVASVFDLPLRKAKTMHTELNGT